MDCKYRRKETNHNFIFNKRKMRKRAKLEGFVIEFISESGLHGEGQLGGVLAAPV